MDIKRLLNNNIAQFFIFLLLAFGVFFGFLIIYGYVQPSYIKLLILWIGSSVLFAALGALIQFRFKMPYAALALFMASFCCLSLYVSQRLADVEFFYDSRVKKEQDEALEKLKEENRPYVAEALLSGAKEHLEKGEFENAWQALREALIFDSTNVEIYFTFGELYTKMDIPEAALDFYYRGLLKDIDNPEIHSRVGALNYKIGNLDEAIMAYGTAVKFDPSLETAKTNLRIMQSLKEGEEQAIREGMMRVVQVVLDTKEEAQVILEMLEEGADIGILAYKYSIDSATKEVGGKTPFLDPEQREYAFIEEVQRMKIGEESGILETGGKYFIIKRIN